MRLSCEASAKDCTKTLVEDIRALGIEPIITTEVIRAVYEGDDEELGNAIIERFRAEAHYGFVADRPDSPVKRRRRKGRR